MIAAVLLAAVFMASAGGSRASASTGPYLDVFKAPNVSMFGNGHPVNLTDNDANAVELGVKFSTAASNVSVTGVRFFKGDSTNGGTHVGTLWSPTGQVLAQATFTNETSTGWQQVIFPTPVSLSPNQTYTASYYAPQGHYTAANGFFDTAWNAGILQAPTQAGVYNYTASPGAAMPTQTYQASNYFVDVLYSTTTPPPAQFTVTAFNNGDSSATGSTLTDNLPAGFNWATDAPSPECAITNGALNCSLGTVGAFGSGTTVGQTIHVWAAVPSSACGTTISNTATVADNEETFDPTEQVATASETLSCPTTTADVSVVKTADQASITAGQTAAFTITETSNGPATATAVTLNDPLPSGYAWTQDNPNCSIASGTVTCSFGTQAAGASQVIHLTAPTSATACGVIPNTVTVSAGNDSNPNNNTSSATITCTQPATQTISGHIYLCSSGAQTTTEVPGGTLGATGPQTVPTQPNPLGPLQVPAGTYTMTATSPSGYQLVACGNYNGSPTQSVVVPPGGSGVGIFYVAVVNACPAPVGYPDLGGASGYTVFALHGVPANQTGNFSNDTVNGDVAVASGATVTNQAPSTINGNVYVDSGGSFSGPGKVNGTVFTGQDLSSARTSAINASAQAAALSPDFTFADITSNTTVTGVSGMNVVDITGKVNLNNASLTLTGPSDAYFVVNIAGSMNLVGTGGIVVGGSVPVSHLIINMTGSGSNLINTHIGNVVQGTLLGPTVGGSLDGTFGSLLLGQNFSLMSGVKVSFEGCIP